MTTRRDLLLAGLSLSLLASCGPPPEAPAYPDIRFNNETPIELDASRIDISDQYQPSGNEASFPVTPLQALQNWAHDRLKAGGQGNLALFTIINASATTKDLPVKGGIGNAFTDQLSQEYAVSVDATLSILDAHGMPVRTIHVTASRSHSVLQSASANDRAKARYDLVKALMAAFDQQMGQQIRDNFGLYLLSR